MTPPTRTVFVDLARHHVGALHKPEVRIVGSSNSEEPEHLTICGYCTSLIELGVPKGYGAPVQHWPCPTAEAARLTADPLPAAPNQGSGDGPTGTDGTDDRGHTPATCTREDCYGCQFCDGGLYGCNVCGGLEGAMPSRCPGASMTQTQIDEVYAGRLDYRDDLWVNACSPDSPARWRDGHWTLRDNDQPISEHPSLKAAVAAGKTQPGRLLSIHDNEDLPVAHMRDGKILDKDDE